MVQHVQQYSKSSAMTPWCGGDYLFHPLQQCNILTLTKLGWLDWSSGDSENI